MKLKDVLAMFDEMSDLAARFTDYSDIDELLQELYSAIKKVIENNVLPSLALTLKNELKISKVKLQKQEYLLSSIVKCIENYESIVNQIMNFIDNRFEGNDGDDSAYFNILNIFIQQLDDDNDSIRSIFAEYVDKKAFEMEVSISKLLCMHTFFSN